MQSKCADNLFNGPQPGRVVMGFVDDDAYSGKINKNPYNFESFGVSKIVIYSGGQQFPSSPLQPQFDNVGASVESYYTMFTGMGIHHGDDGNAITREMYMKGGYVFYCFDLTQDMSASKNSHWNTNRLGNFRVDVSFKAGVSKNIVCVVLGEFQKLAQVDLRRNITISS